MQVQGLLFQFPCSVVLLRCGRANDPGFQRDIKSLGGHCASYWTMEAAKAFEEDSIPGTNVFVPMKPISDERALQAGTFRKS